MNIASHSLRTSFLEFFKRHHHHIEPSAPLIPKDDPTLLFVNAGMVQFKNVFTQKEMRPYKKAASSQKCVRAGGKHNDLENVGHTARHHTFFEMLGNFSFGDYFKEEAITLAWKFLTEELKLDKERLSVTVFGGDEQIPADLEAERIWIQKIGLSPNKITRLGREDNFWQMGDVGPCGPCSEIHYDRGAIKGAFGMENEGDRNIEVWNLVFMQYEQMPDASFKPLPAPCVDTGMGLERLLCVVNNLESNYDTDLLRPIIAKVESLSGKEYRASKDEDDVAMRVLADHARATAFLIADGLTPANEGRGYVLRRIMRRAIRHGALLGLSEPFFHEVCLMVSDLMGPSYEELLVAKPLMAKVVWQEEESFRKTLDRGLALLESEMKNQKPGNVLTGSLVFKLHDTYGFPPDLTENIAHSHGLSINWQEFFDKKKEHELSSSAGLGLKGVDDIYFSLVECFGKTRFIDKPVVEGLKVQALLKDSREVEMLDYEGFVVLDKSPFYAESGGQVGDNGILIAEGLKAKVIDTKKIAGLHVHLIKIEEGQIHKGMALSGEVDWVRRQAIKRNHSATHLLHSALRKVLGTHVIQRGSLVAPDRLRFDFSHFEAMTRQEMAQVETLVNEWILANEEAKVQLMSMDEARSYGALALFGEKYEQEVRVLDMGSHSIELCGGTHCARTGDIGSFRIIGESPLAQGIRRIEAVTGLEAVNIARYNDLILKDLGRELGVKKEEIPARVGQVLNDLKAKDKALKSLNTSSIKDMAKSISETAKDVGSVKLVLDLVTGINNTDELRSYADMIRDSIGSGIVILGLRQDENKCLLLVALTKDLSSRFHAGKIVSKLAPIINGKGGGRPDFAQAGGAKPEALEQALKSAPEVIASFDR